MAFATYEHLSLQYDVRRIAELASDTGRPLTVGDLPTNSVIEWALERATEMVLMHCRIGKRYTESDLQTLADSASVGWSLRGLVCDLAYGLLTMRRGTGAGDLDRLSPAFRSAQQTLQMLASGAEIFARIDGEQHADAGTPRTADLTNQTTSPSPHCSWATTASYNMLPSTQQRDNCC